MPRLRRGSRLITLCFGLWLVAAGCKSEAEPPDNLLSKAEMAAILLEVHVLEAKVNKRATGRDSIQEVYEHYEAMLFADMGVDTAAYNASIRYYLENAEEFSEIYAVVVDSLQVRSKNKSLQ